MENKKKHILDDKLHTFNNLMQNGIQDTQIQQTSLSTAIVLFRWVDLVKEKLGNDYLKTSFLPFFCFILWSLAMFRVLRPKLTSAPFCP